MAHNIQAFIFRTDLSRHLTGSLPDQVQARLVPLRQDLVLLTLTESFLSAFMAERPGPSESAHPEFEMLNEVFSELGRKLSEHGPVAYVETEYFGGWGTQSALVWKGGAIAFGPKKQEEPGPINGALQHLGVKVFDKFDEFDQVGLGLHRHNDD